MQCFTPKRLSGDGYLHRTDNIENIVYYRRKQLRVTEILLSNPLRRLIRQSIPPQAGNICRQEGVNADLGKRGRFRKL